MSWLQMMDNDDAAPIIRDGHVHGKWEPDFNTRSHARRALSMLPGGLVLQVYEYHLDGEEPGIEPVEYAP